MMKNTLATALARIEQLSQMDEKTHKPHKNDIAQRDNITYIKENSSNINYINNKPASPSSDYPPDMQDAFEHNIYNRPYLSNLEGLRDADNAKLCIDSNLAYSNKKSNSNDDSYTPHNQHKTTGHYVGLKLRVNSDPVFLLAQQWGMLAKWLYILCRDYGEQMVKAKIQYVAAIGDAYFGDAESISTQRGKMTTHLVRSCKPRRTHAQQKT